MQDLLRELIDSISVLNTDITTLNSNLVLFKNQNIDEDSYIEIDFSHHEVHEGNSFNVCATEIAGASLSISFKTNSKDVHLVADYSCESKSHVDIKEGVAVTATTGTEETIYNRNRNSSNISTISQNKSGAFVVDSKVLIGATVVGGTVISEHYTWGDKKIGAQRRGRAERVLKRDTEYQIILISDDGDKGLHLELSWYEIDG